MKFQKAKLLFGLALIWLATPLCRADYETKFNEPPYELGKTIVGVDGWVASKSTNNGSKTHGIMIGAPWEPTQTVLRLQGSSTNTEKVRVKNSSFAPFSSGEVKVAVGLAFHFDPAQTMTNGAKASFAFFDLSSGYSPIGFGLDYAPNGGLFYTAAADKDTPNLVHILAANEIKMNSVYEFTLTINLDQKTFDFLVTGLKVDDTPFSYSASSISIDGFRDGIPLIDTLYVENMGPASSTTYFEHASIHAIPEPGTVALLLGGGVATTLLALRKRYSSATDR